MQQSVLYANASIAMQLSENLLTREHIRNMVSADSYENALRVLTEIGYDIENKTEDEVINSEQEEVLKTFVSLSTDDSLTYCVTKMFGKEEFNTAAAKTNPNLSSQEIDTLAEIAFFADIEPIAKKIKDKNIRKYFAALADLTNLKTFAKYRLIKKLPKDVFVAGGEIGNRTWADYFNTDDGALQGIFNGTDYGDVFPALQTAIEEQKMEVLEDAIGEYLDGVAATNKDDIFKSNLLFWWLLEKQKEFVAVKTILMGKKFNFSASHIRENLRGLYERFK